MALQFGSFMPQKNLKKIFVFQKKCIRLLTFLNFLKHTSPIFKSLEVLKLQYKIQYSILNIICFYFNDQLLLQVKNIFLQNESVSPYNSRGGEVLFIPYINATHFYTK